MEIFLAKLFGVYLIIVGGAALLRRRAFMPTVRELLANRALLMVMAFLELGAGLAVILAYPTVSTAPIGVVSLIGWMLVIESIVYLALPAKKVQQLVGGFNTTTWHIVGGVIAVGAGLYLARFGFGLM